MKRIFILLFSLAVVFGLGTCYIYSIKNPNVDAVRVYFPRNATEEMLKDTLYHHLGADFGEKVFWIWNLNGGNLSTAHGSYVVQPGEKALTVARTIADGRQTPVRVTLNNMRTLDDLAKRMASKLELSASDFLSAVDSVLGNDETYRKKSEFLAAFLPDTYEFYWNVDPEKAVKRLVDVRNLFWNDERCDKAKKLGLTPVEIAVVASIVEEESNRKDEHPTIARLYLNRLEKNMLLQADPTVKFAIGDFTMRRITAHHLKIDSPYNTYLYQGLPPGPIRIPEKSTIDAVLDAPSHRYMYMCAKEDFSGRHNFAVDYTTHLRNAARYQAELNRRGIRR